MLFFLLSFFTHVSAFAPVLSKIGPSVALIAITLQYTFAPNTGTYTNDNNNNTATALAQITSQLASVTSSLATLSSTALALQSGIAKLDATNTSILSSVSTVSINVESLRNLVVTSNSSLDRIFKKQPDVFNDGLNHMVNLVAFHRNGEAEVVLPGNPLPVFNTPPVPISSTTEIPLAPEDNVVDRVGPQTIEAPPVEEASVTYTRRRDPAVQRVQEVTGFLERRYPIAPISWTTSSGRGVNLYVVDPLRYILSQKQVWSKLQGYRYFRTRAQVRFQITGNAFMAGLLRAVWIPPTRVDEVMNGDNSLVMVTGINNFVEISPSTNGTYSIDLPFIFPKRFMDLTTAHTKWSEVNASVSSNSHGPDDNFVSLGLIAIYVVSPLRSGVASFSHITPFVSLTDFELADVYDPASVPVTPPVYDAPAPVNLYDITPAPQVSNVRCALALPSSLISMTEAIDKSFNPLRDAVKGVGGLIDTVLDIASPILGIFNLDKPRDIGTPIRTLPTWKDLTHSDGLEQATHLGLKSNCAVSAGVLDQQPCEYDDSITKLAETEQLIGSLDIPDTIASDTLVWNWFVAPWNVPYAAYSPITVSGSKGGQFLCYNTFASYLSQLFGYWTGTACVRVQVVGDGFSKIGLALAWIPGTTEVPSQPLSQTVISNDMVANSHSKIAMIDGSGDITFEIPFINEEYALLSDISFPNIVDGALKGAVNGRFGLIVVNPLINSSLQASAEPISVNIYVSWKNLSFYRLQSNAMSNTPPSATMTWPTSTPISEVTNMPASPVDSKGEVAPAPLTTVSISENALFGESIVSIQDIIRRPSYLGTRTGVVKDETAIVSLFSSFPFVVGSTAPDQLSDPSALYRRSTYSTAGNFLLFLSRMYLTWRGEVTYTVINYTESDEETVHSTECQAFWASNCLDRRGAKLRSIPAAGSSVLTGLTRADFTNMPGFGAAYRPINTPNNPLSVIVPYYTTHSFLFTPSYNNTTKRTGFYHNAAFPAARFQTSFDTAGSSYQYHVLAAAGDNFRMSYAYPPPTTRNYIFPGITPTISFT